MGGVEGEEGGVAEAAAVQEDMMEASKPHPYLTAKQKRQVCCIINYVLAILFVLFAALLFFFSSGTYASRSRVRSQPRPQL